jgi:tetratricopeptide (TPR) repeat protein
VEAKAFHCTTNNLNSEYPLAKEAARKALELNDSLSIAHSALAFAIYRGDWDFATAGREFQRALQFGPNDPMSLATYALYLFSLGRIDECIEETRRVLQVDPLSPLHNSSLAVAYIFAGREQEGVLQAKTALDIAPNFSFAHVVLGLAYEHLGQYDRAAAECRKAGNAFGEGFLPLSMAHLYASEGRRVEALKLVAQSGPAKSNLFNTSYELAEIYARLDEKGAGFCTP